MALKKYRDKERHYQKTNITNGTTPITSRHSPRKTNLEMPARDGNTAYMGEQCLEANGC